MRRQLVPAAVVLMGKVDGTTEVLTVSLHDLTGKALYSVDLHPA